MALRCTRKTGPLPVEPAVAPPHLAGADDPRRLAEVALTTAAHLLYNRLVDGNRLARPGSPAQRRKPT